ncbi:MAG: hypothetical protein JWO46_3347 [Nocardioidaceae bacterium]|nr:hypothetical protein [Nocardioidaceae bacterium]
MVTHDAPSALVVPHEERSRNRRLVDVGVVPFVFGAVGGVLLGWTAVGYWILQVVASVGAVLAGAEHRTPGSGARRGATAGAVFGVGLLLAHVVSGKDATVSLGGFPPALIVITAVAGSILTALGAALIGRRLHR